uniref:Uncharacterized protein n=1 Tax=Kalanchoe fedtschenkoi TaxID=63787 RepID=A0A7N0T448_KALFE
MVCLILVHMCNPNQFWLPRSKGIKEKGPNVKESEIQLGTSERRQPSSINHKYQLNPIAHNLSLSKLSMTTPCTNNQRHYVGMLFTIPHQPSSCRHPNQRFKATSSQLPTK